MPTRRTAWSEALPERATKLDEDLIIAHDAVNRTVTIRDSNGGAPVRTLADGLVTNLRFTYRDPSRNITTNPANVAFILTTVTVRTRLNDLNQGRPLEYTLSSEVRVRSR